MDRFSKYNPKATLLFFLLAVLQSIIIFNPIFLSISLVCAFLYKLKLCGKSAVAYLFRFILPLIVLTSVFNMLFAHYGMTALFTVGNTTFTLESLFYGFTQGLMLCSVMLWFSCYNELVSGEMLLSVFGGVLPNTALIFSMTLTFIPRLKRNASEIRDARMLLDEKGSRLFKAVNNLSALVMLTLEDSIDVIDSMKARGFNGKRTAYSKYRFSARDLLLIILECTLFIAVVVFRILGKTDFLIDPMIKIVDLSPLAIAAYTLLAILPLMVDLTEDIRWNYLKQRI